MCHSMFLWIYSVRHQGVEYKLLLYSPTILDKPFMARSIQEPVSRCLSLRCRFCHRM